MIMQPIEHSRTINIYLTSFIWLVNRWTREVTMNQTKDGRVNQRILETENNNVQCLYIPMHNYILCLLYKCNG